MGTESLILDSDSVYFNAPLEVNRTPTSKLTNKYPLPTFKLNTFK